MPPRLLVSIALMTLLAATLSAQELRKEKFHLGPWEDEIGYTQAVRVGNTLYLSGSVGEGAMPDALRGAFDSIRRTLAAYGLDFRHVVKENAYTTDLDALKAVQDVRKTYYGTDFPATTWVQVARLYDPRFVLEVEVIAVFPDQPATAAPPASKPAPSTAP